MKIGFSYGRCVRDIVKDIVDPNDVLLIITRTSIQDSAYIPSMIRSYQDRSNYLEGLDYDACEKVARDLLLSGKIYQPRLHGVPSAVLPRIMEEAVWMDLAPTMDGETHQSEQVVQAWRAYQMALKLTSPRDFPKLGPGDF